MLKPYNASLAVDKKTLICPHCRKKMYPPKPLTEGEYRCPKCHGYMDLESAEGQNVNTKIIDGMARILGKTRVIGLKQSSFDRR